MAIISKEIFSYAWEEVQCPQTGLAQLSPRFWRHMGLLQALRQWWGCPLPVVRGFLSRLDLKALENPRLPDQVRQTLIWEAEHLIAYAGAARFATDVRVPQPAHKTRTLHQAVGYLADKAEYLGFTGIGLSDGELHLDLATHEVVRWDQRTAEGWAWSGN